MIQSDCYGQRRLDRRRLICCYRTDRSPCQKHVNKLKIYHNMENFQPTLHLDRSPPTNLTRSSHTLPHCAPPAINQSKILTNSIVLITMGSKKHESPARKRARERVEKVMEAVLKASVAFRERKQGFVFLVGLLLPNVSPHIRLTEWL